MIKAIETVYKGYRFRSRLEARWAVFFDALGWEWEYEKEGFDIDGVWYLPDFWLPDANTFVEVKPDYPSDREWEKLWALAEHHRVILVTGTPAEVSYTYCDYQGGDCQGSDCHWKYGVLLHWHKGEVGNFECTWDDPGEDFSDYFKYFPEYTQAVHAARQARFEHGESG